MSATEDSERRTGRQADEGGADNSVLGRWIAVSLAAIALVGAGIAVLQTQASVNEANTARETTRAAVAALRAGVIEEAGKLLEDDVKAESGSLRREQAFLARQSGDAAQPLTSEQLESLLPNGSELPAARTREQLRRISFDSEKQSLRQAALAETRVTWNDRSTQYTTAIAILAFALFLVGFSLVLRGRRRLVFYTFGIAIAVLTVGMTVYFYLLPIPETAAEAIDSTARGTVASGEGDQGRATRFFDEAIEIDGDYAEPYARRAVARTLAANPDFQQTGALVGGDDAVRAALSDARRALELDSSDFTALAFLSIISLYAGEYEQSVRTAEGAIADNSQIPDVRLVKSAAEVGLGDAEAATASLDAASDLLRGSDASERIRGLVANYLTYLEQVADRVPERTDLVSRLEQRVIGSETELSLGRGLSRMQPGRGSIELSDLSYADGRISLRTRWRNLPADTSLTLIGFERPALGSAWVQPRELALFRTIGGSGEVTSEVPIKRRCTPVELRVDAYLDGALVESAIGPGGAATC